MKYFSNHLYSNVFMYLCTEEFKDCWCGCDLLGQTSTFSILLSSVWDVLVGPSYLGVG